MSFNFKVIFLTFNYLFVYFLRPYDGKWSKTMIGYGPEANHFVCELTYNYGISDYAMGK